MNTVNSDRICVQVFAKIIAAITHELKNTLSIINENAGLLDDLAMLAEQAGGLPLERVQAITGTIMKQVDRSNLILKNMNRFAHSGDTSLAHADLSETLSLMVALTNRQAAMKNINVEVDCPPDLAIHTHLMHLEALIFLTLYTLFECSMEGTTLTIQATAEEPNLTLRFLADDGTGLKPASYPDENEQILAEQINASCHQKPNDIGFTFPGNID